MQEKKNKLNLKKIQHLIENNNYPQKKCHIINPAAVKNTKRSKAFWAKKHIFYYFICINKKKAVPLWAYCESQKQKEKKINAGALELKKFILKTISVNLNVNFCQ
jgi:hypothetical protein